MKRLAYEAMFPWEKFNDANECIAIARQMLGAMRAQLRDQGELDGRCILSIMLAYEPTQDGDVESTYPAILPISGTVN